MIYTLLLLYANRKNNNNLMHYLWWMKEHFSIPHSLNWTINQWWGHLKLAHAQTKEPDIIWTQTDPLSRRLQCRLYKGGYSVGQMTLTAFLFLRHFDGEAMIKLWFNNRPHSWLHSAKSFLFLSAAQWHQGAAAQGAIRCFNATDTAWVCRGKMISL